MTEASILVASPDSSLTALLEETLRQARLSVRSVARRDDVLTHLHAEHPDALLLDADLDPGGSDWLAELRVRHRDLTVVALVWETDRDAAVHLMRMGATELLTKPVDRDALPFRLGLALERNRLAVNDRLYKLALEKRITSRTGEVWEKRDQLRSQMLGIVEALAQTLAAKHSYTEGHSRRVTAVSLLLARAAGISAPELREVELAARFHDIGKIGIRDEVLNKAGKLTPAEYEHIKSHPLIAERILNPIPEFRSFLPLVKHEHERYDGKGYPSGLSGTEIPLGARIIAVADAYDALVSDRRYRRGCPPDAALAEIRRSSGTQFDPRLVELFAALVRDGALAALDPKAKEACGASE